MDLVGKVLADRYEIIEEVGKGGMAIVYKAHCRLLNRYVAVKVLKEDFKDDKEFVRRFNIEAQAAARIQNPHIVSVFDVGCEDGLYYIVMEYVEGITLKQYIDKVKVVPWREAVGYAIQISEGLEEAHKNSVIHRDIKPQNIIMTNDGVLKVTDFGIARATSQSTMTMAKSTIGTAHYLSPEQARGGYTDERTDIYSLGIVLYEMLTGKLPFNDESPVAIAIKHIQEKPKRPTELNPEIPLSVEQIVLKAIDKEQNARYENVTALLKDLRHVLNHPEENTGNGTAVPVYDGDTTIKMPSVHDADIRDYGEQKTDRFEHDFDADKEEEKRKLKEMEYLRNKRAKRKKDRRVAAVAILAAVLVIAGLAVAFAAITGGTSFLTGETVEIPQLVDMNIEKAQNRYKDQFSIVIRSREESTKDAGTILEQTPSAGQKVRKQDDMVINVIVSAGTESITLTDYAKKNVEDVQKELEQMGLKVNIVEVASDSDEAGTVLSQSPSAGSKVQAGDLITLNVSKGSSENDKTGEENAEATERPTERPTTRPTETPAANDDTDDGNTGSSYQGGSSNQGNSSGQSGNSSGGNNTSSGNNGTSSGSSGTSSGSGTSSEGSASGSESGTSENTGQGTTSSGSGSGNSDEAASGIED